MMYDGMITGTYTEIAENEKIVMEWRMKDWQEGVHCEVTLKFSDAGNSSTDVQVQLEKVPEYDTYNKFVHLDNLEGGWRNMIF